MKQFLRLNILDYVNSDMLVGLGTFWFLMPCCFRLDVTKRHLSPKPQKRNNSYSRKQSPVERKNFLVPSLLDLTKRFLRLDSNTPAPAVKITSP